jgi:hypothetical protein
MGKDNSRQTGLSNTANTAGSAYNRSLTPSPLETKFTPKATEMWNNYSNGANQQTQDYSNIMGGYQDFTNRLLAKDANGNIIGPKTYGASSVSVNRPEELTKAYGYLDEAAPGYRNFAETGGYSPTDIQELRARGSAPITSAYSNAAMEMNRARTLGGAGGSPNYIAAMSKMQRELPGQLATATTGVNASLADAIRQGKLSGLAGLTGIGGEMGGLASAESGRQLQAGIANQGAGLQAEGLNQQSLRDWNGAQLSSLGGQASLYGTTPAMAATFGNQALNASGQEFGAEEARNRYGLGALGTQMSSYAAMPQSKPWWQQALGAAGSIVPYLGKFLKPGTNTTDPNNPYATTPEYGLNPNDTGQRTYETGIPGVTDYTNSPGYYNQPGVNITEGQGSNFWSKYGE